MVFFLVILGHFGPFSFEPSKFFFPRVLGGKSKERKV